MTTRRTPVRHGERRCYQAGCRRPECLNAHYRWCSRYRLDVHEGRPRRVDAAESLNHIQALLDAGWMQSQIARAANLAHRVLTSVRAGQETVSVSTAQAILSVPIGPPPGDQRDVDATGTIRRVRALVAIGWPVAQLAPRFGLYVTALGAIARGELQNVRATTAKRVAHEYRDLSRTPGNSNRARNDARRNNWHGPLAWDDTTIDDPSSHPEVEAAEPHALNRDELAAIRRADVEHLDGFGASPEEIARRLGMALSTVKGIVAELRAGERRDRSKVAA
ncbi:hypothetical protein GTY67_13685 [Streptomyces sp. SID8374]|uniref:hypothetical protein n=1 Tax=Streptomyces sp. SID8374 TaxID=2690354 RepID=UPI00136D5DEF|nr:hypothetical protein [Streptomyces sp. SID8374]MYX14449.1 hypothetical protein [Streptomyces sp. SID8374]